MDNNIIADNLKFINSSRLDSISRLYDYNCNTSRVYKLHRALGMVINTCKRSNILVDPMVEHDEVIDLYNSLVTAIKQYKINHNRITFPKDFTVFELIDDLQKLNPAQIIRQVFDGRGEKEGVKNDKARKKSKKDFDKDD